MIDQCLSLGQPIFGQCSHFLRAGVFERIMHKQISEYINQFLSPNICGYRRGFSTQRIFLSLLEKWKTLLDSKGYVGAVFMVFQKRLVLLIMISL